MSYDVIQSVIHNAIFKNGTGTGGTGGTGASSNLFEEKVTQTTHGFSLNEAVAHDGTNFVKADINRNDLVLGIVSEIVSVDEFKFGKIGYIQNSALSTLLNTVESDNFLYLGVSGALVKKSHSSISILNKIPVIKKIESDKAEIVTSTQYLGFKNDKSLSTLYFGSSAGKDTIEEGTWKVVVENQFLNYYRYESGSWVFKTKMGASIVSDSFVLEDASGQFAFERPGNIRKTLLKPSIDGYGAVLGNPEGRVALVSKGEHTIAYPSTKDPVWITDNAGNGTYSPANVRYEESTTITSDEIMYKVKLYVKTQASKFRFSLIKEDDNTVLLQNLTKSEYDLNINTNQLVVGENIIPLKYPIAFTKGLKIKAIVETPTATSFETGADGKIANSIYRKFASLGTINHSSKWISDRQYVKEDIINIETIDVDYDGTLTGRYVCLKPHTSGVDFKRDLRLKKWEKINEFSKFNYYAGVVEAGGVRVIQGSGGTVICMDAKVNLYDNDIFQGIPKEYNVRSSGVMQLVDMTTNYVIVDYNNGSPSYSVTQDVGRINGSSIIPVTTIYRNGTYVHKIPWGNMGNGLANKINARLVKTDRFKIESGFHLSEFGTRNMLISSGAVWYGANKLSLDAVNSSSDNYKLYYHTSPNSWNYVPVDKYNNVNYDDGTGGLKTLSSKNKYNCSWVFRGVENYKEAAIVLGPQFKNYKTANNSEPPRLPDVVRTQYILVGRIICKKGSLSSDVQNLTSNKFVSSDTSYEKKVGWKDNMRLFSAAKGRGTNEPDWSNMGNNQFAYKFKAGDELFITYHVDHDYKRGTNAYPHIHFCVTSGMQSGQRVVWEFGYVVARGHSTGHSLTAPETKFNMVYTATGLETPGEHIILECSDAQAFSLIEPDTIILSRIKLDSESVNGDVFGFMCDLHYQSDSESTVNKEPDFYS